MLSVLWKLGQPGQARREALPADAAKVALQCFPLGDRILGQIVGIQSEGEIAALGNHHRIAQRLRNIRKASLHLLGAAEILSLAVTPGPARIAQDPPLVDTDLRLVGLVIVGLKKAHVIRRDHRHSAAG